MAALDPINTALNEKQLSHLLRRATFGFTNDDLIALSGQSLDVVLNTLFETVEDPEPPIDLATGLSWLPAPVDNINSDNGDLLDFFLSWWLDQMRTSGINIKEKLVFFLHTHITTRSSVAENATALYYQNALFRTFATGSFKELMLKVCFDNSMLVFLDGRDNIEGNPQENFGREFLELYTIGRGEQISPGDYTNYNEDDVQACAKIFSGYIEDLDFLTIDPETNIPRGKLKGDGEIATRHDASEKQLSGAFNNAVIAPDPATIVDGLTTKEEAMSEVEQLVDIVFAQEETARYICRRLYRFFCYYNITDEIETNVIIPLAQTYMANDFNMRPVLEQLFRSQHFYDLDNGILADDIQGAIIKSPIDLMMNTFRVFDIEFPTNGSEGFYKGAYDIIIRTLDNQGLPLYDPFEVAGYTAYHQFPAYNRNWISANFLGYRYLFQEQLIQGIGTDDFPMALNLDVVDFVRNRLTGVLVADGEQLVQKLIDLLLPKPVDEERFSYFYNDILLDDLPATNWPEEWVRFQLTGDDMVVRTQLESLFIALLQAPEYQLM